MAGDLQKDIDAVGRIAAVPIVLAIICRTFGVGFAAVARVTDTRWVACQVHDEIAFGLEAGGEIPLQSTICSEIRQHLQPIIINHVAEDPAWRDHHTPRQYGFQSYISVPLILRDGSFFGSLCAIDPRPNRLLAPETVGIFQLYASLIATELSADAQLFDARRELAEHQEAAILREQFIAVLGHDLRSPVAALDAALLLLGRQALNADGQDVLDLAHGTTQRMQLLIEDVLDFARARLGQGLAMDNAPVELLPTLQLVLAEFRNVYPDRTIQADYLIDRPIHCDSGRIGQLVSNLLGNAMIHGDRDRLTRICATTDGDTFTICVSNHGAPIPAEAIGRLFQPFFRSGTAGARKGLGLGLFIASEIAKGHGGTLDVTSDVNETRFTFRMPLHQRA